MCTPATQCFGFIRSLASHLGHSATHRKDEILSLPCLPHFSDSRATPLFLKMQIKASMACFVVFAMERCDLSIVPKSRILKLWQTVADISADFFAGVPCYKHLSRWESRWLFCPVNLMAESQNYPSTHCSCLCNRRYPILNV